MKNKMEIWEQVCETDPNTTKVVEFGKRKYTSINATSQIKSATELFGPFGGGWGVSDEEYMPVSHGSTTLLLYTAILWYKHKEYDDLCKIPIASSSILGTQDRCDDDCVKKVSTDALTKGLSKLGFNADVFEGRFDDNKYVSKLRDKYFKYKLSDEQRNEVRLVIEGIENKEERDKMLAMLDSTNKINATNYKSVISKLKGQL